MKSQEIAEKIVACIELRARYDEEHRRAKISQSREGSGGIYPLPEMDPRSIPILMEKQALERQMLTLCPPRCSKEPGGNLKNQEPVWFEEWLFYFISKESRQALAAALAVTMVEFGATSVSESVEVILPLSTVAEEDGGDASRIQSGSEGEEPTHRVSFELFRHPETGAWILDDLPVVIGLAEERTGGL